MRLPWRRRVQPTRVRPEARPTVVNRVGLHELTPSLDRFLAQAALTQLALHELLSRAIVVSPEVSMKLALARVAHVTLDRHRLLVEALEDEGLDAAAAMHPYTAEVEEFQRRVLGADGDERIMTVYVVSGMLDDTFAAIAGGLPGDYPGRMQNLLGPESTRAVLAAVLADRIEANPALASRLALWGRRLVGDTLLLARSACEIPPDTATDDERLEPVFESLIADHTRRMDNLGLTA